MKANDRLGLVLGVLVLTPFYQWKHSHAIHHATAGDLDRRGIGDVYTMTVEEYLAAPWYKKVGLSHHAQPDHPVHGRFVLCLYSHASLLGKGRRETRTQQCDLDEHCDCRGCGLVDAGDRLGGFPAGRSAYPADRLWCRRLAVLCAAQLRPDLLGTPRRVGVLQRWHGWQFVL